MQARRLAPRGYLLGAMPITALFVLVLNDRVLKHRSPSWWTGKASDVAGLVLLPIVLCAAAATARRLASHAPYARRGDAIAVALVVAAGFAIVKTIPSATGVAEVVNGWMRWPIDLVVDTIARDEPSGPRRSWIVTDPTDLLTLPAVVVGFRHVEAVRRRLSGGEPDGGRTRAEHVSSEVQTKPC